MGEVPYQRVCINTNELLDWESFHNVFSDAFGFPSFYGRNMNAWIDCLTSLDCPEDALTNVHTPQGGIMVIHLQDGLKLKERNREIYDAIIECSAFVNFRRIEVGESPIISLSF